MWDYTSKQFLYDSTHAKNANDTNRWRYYEEVEHGELGASDRIMKKLTGKDLHSFNVGHYTEKLLAEIRDVAFISTTERPDPREVLMEESCHCCGRYLLFRNSRRVGLCQHCESEMAWETRRYPWGDILCRSAHTPDEPYPLTPQKLEC